MAGLPQSLPTGTDQSSVTISALAPASRATSARSSSRSLSADQCTWKNSFPLAAATSAAGLLANSLSPMAVPAAAVPIATATSPSGCTACAPTGEAMTGRPISTPSTEVRRSPAAGPAGAVTGAVSVVVAGASLGGASRGGANRISPNAVTLSALVTPASEPASIAEKTGPGSRRRARRRASATDSNRSPVDGTWLAQLQWPDSAGTTCSANASNAASIEVTPPPPRARQSLLARKVRPPNTIATTRGRGSVSGSTPSRRASTRTMSSSWSCAYRRWAASSEGVLSISRTTSRYMDSSACGPSPSASVSSDVWNALRSAVSGGSAGGLAASSRSSASAASWANDSARSSLLAKYLKNVRSQTSTASVISRTAVCSYPLALNSRNAARTRASRVCCFFRSRRGGTAAETSCTPTGYLYVT